MIAISKATKPTPLYKSVFWTLTERLLLPGTMRVVSLGSVRTVPSGLQFR